jgi:hypothetical protein
MNATPTNGYGSNSNSQDEKFVPLADFEHMKKAFFEERELKLKKMDEVDQLRDALSKVNAGIHRASDMQEGIIETMDQNIITNLAIDLLKHRPKLIRIKYKGSEWKEVYHE